MNRAALNRIAAAEGAKINAVLFHRVRREIVLDEDVCSAIDAVFVRSGGGNGRVVDQSRALHVVRTLGIDRDAIVAGAT